MTKPDRKPLSALNIERIWPVLSPTGLSYLEIKQDPYFSYIPEEDILPIIDFCISYGDEIAKQQPNHPNYHDLLNHMIQNRIRIRFRHQHPADPLIRAQYLASPPTIDIFRNSLHQIQTFFQQHITTIDENDLNRLHLYHEFFHHLEKTKRRSPMMKKATCTIKQWGPVAIRKTLSTCHEIAAHAFTQTMMKLNWSPLLIDRLIYYNQQGWSNGQIREQFTKIQNEIKRLKELARDTMDTPATIY